MNNALVKQEASLRRQCWTNALYSWRESVGIIGMSSWVAHSTLEKTVCKVLQQIWADTCEEKLKSYNRLNKKRWSDNCEIFRGKDCEHVMRVKKDLKDLNPNNLDFPEGTRLFIIDNLCPYYRVLWNKYKKLSINKK